MIAILDDTNRQVVPRWLDYYSSCALGLLRIVRVPKSFLKQSPPNYRTEFDWLNKPSLATAVDLVAEALILKAFESKPARTAAQFILKNTALSDLLIREIAQHFLEEPTVQQVVLNDGQIGNEMWTGIAILKKAVRNHPLDPIAWSDLALSYAVIGQLEKSRQTMQVAVSLGKYNRFILRSAARCYFHLQEPDRAIRLLRESELCELDPWIASAEIAISDWMGSRSSCIKSGRELIRNRNLSPFSISELAACIGTLEIKNGSIKKGKSLIREALRDPSENAFAQAEWIATQLKTEFPIPAFIQASYEAQTRHYYRGKDFKLSFKAAEQWARFQRFSSRPLILATFLASVCLNDDQRAVSIIRKSAPTHYNSPLLMNNFAFALARSGEVATANDTLNKISNNRLSERERFTVAATRGLIYYRSGNIERGSELYRNAVNGFDKMKDSRSAAIAAYFWAFEEKRVKSADAAARISDAKKRIKKSDTFELEELAIKL